jgi:hypothetical protein
MEEQEMQEKPEMTMEDLLEENEALRSALDDMAEEMAKLKDALL